MLEKWNDGIMECWKKGRNGEMVKGRMKKNPVNLEIL